jgi:preprotein translocase subunit SecB
MKLAPIQLEGYALIELVYRANPEYQQGQPSQYEDDDLVVGTKLDRDDSADNRWRVFMKIQLQPRASANGPYHVTLQLAGVVRVNPDFKSQDVETVIRVNGASMLYGVAREIVRNTTSLGPHPPILIPAVNFRPETKPDLTPRVLPAEQATLPLPR